MNRNLSTATLALTLGLSLCSCQSKHAASSRPLSVSPGQLVATETPDAAPPTTAVGAAGSACSLVTVAEASTATGQPMKLTGDAGAICAISGVADESTVVYIQVYPDAPSMALLKQGEAGSDHLEGLGDDAFWIPAAGTVFIQKGSRAFSVTLPSLQNLTGTPAAVKSRMVDLATAALARF